MNKKAWCTCKLDVLLNKPVTFLTFSFPLSSSLLKLPNFKIPTRSSECFIRGALKDAKKLWSIIPASERQEFVHSSESKAEKCGPLPPLPQGIELTHFDSFFSPWIIPFFILFLDLNITNDFLLKKKKNRTKPSVAIKQFTCRVSLGECTCILIPVKGF